MPAGGLTSGWRIARIFGITIRIHVTWLLIFFLLTFSLATQILPLGNLADGGSWFEGAAYEREIRASHDRYRDLSTRDLVRRFATRPWPAWHYWVLAVVGTVGLFVCVLAHELSHSIVALGAGIPVGGITLFVFGGVARLKEEARSPGTEFKVAIAGPLMSLALGSACAVLYYGFGSLGPEQARALIYYFMFINLALLVFNLLPGFPLDGGRVLRAALWRLTGDLRRATRWAALVGRVIGTAMVIVAGLMILITWNFGWLWPALIGVFLVHAAKASYQQVAIRHAFAGLTVRDVICRDVVSVPADLTLDRLVDEYFYRHRFPGFPVVAGETLCGMISLKDVQAVPRAGWPYRRVGDAMRPIGNNNAVCLDDDLASVFGRMVQAGRDHVAVVEGGRLLGLVRRHDMLNLLQIRTDLGVTGRARAP